mmetsp:Transcript_4205/g.8666  ORF Transcript_4205/g.8666 Transcript_4205/m.8666 type:complete len:284 (-) Transcript_4205:166-1017(-)|eukprot:CAMPEP_0118934336 /NCGR_PEP_ID=MMETSP1169-20130426/13771_1 /TAXON_ID=36882 /ORGANISM="Pyramimonas obovata, Strain CCMP722" /LENGTH=283 /DNA_ID=CAMNT_0006877231 /DNA_START=101 /DNA_END=952 /DNA_ORIENTATION=-
MTAVAAEVPVEINSPARDSSIIAPPPAGGPNGTSEGFSTHNILGDSFGAEREIVQTENDTTIASNSLLTDSGSAVTYPLAMQYPAANYRVADRGPSLEMEEQEQGVVDQGKFDFRRNRFPYSVVFQPLPPLTWLCPLIGHMGICDSQGRVHDFQGPYTVRVDTMMLGRATRYLPLDPHMVRANLLHGETVQQRWDRILEDGDADFSGKMHMIICQNCNHHVAKCLNLMEYCGISKRSCGGFGCFTMWFWMFFAGRFAGVRGFVTTIVPFVLAVGIYFVYWGSK